MPVLKEVLVDELQDLLHAEGQLVKALPKMARAAKAPQLKTAFEDHLEQTKEHVERLQKAFDLLKVKAKAKPCKAMQGLVSEGEETISEGKGKNPFAADLELVAAAQKVEHYEMSGYGSARVIAEELGESQVVKLLSQTLEEEEAADQLLTKICVPLLHGASQNDENEEGEQ